MASVDAEGKYNQALMSDPAADNLARAELLLRSFQMPQALEEAELALAALESAPQNITARAAAHRIAGEAATALGRFALAEEHLEHASLLLDELGAQADLLACQLELTEAVFRQGNLRSARHLAMLAHDKARLEGWQPLYARSLVCLGNLAWAEGRIAEARQLLAEATALYDKLELQADASRARSSLGVACAIAGENERASELLKQALAQFQVDLDYVNIARCLNNLAGLAFEASDYPRAREYLLQCVELESELGARGDMSTSWFNLALIELGEGNIRLAKKYLHRSLQLAREAGNRNSTGAALLHLAIVAMLENENADAQNLAQLAEAAFSGSSSQHARSTQYYMPLFHLTGGNVARAREAWAALPRDHALDKLELRMLAVLLAHLAANYSDEDAEIQAQVRKCAADWAVSLRKDPPAEKS